MPEARRNIRPPSRRSLRLYKTPTPFESRPTDLSRSKSTMHDRFTLMESGAHFDYTPLWKTLQNHEMQISDLSEIGLTPKTIAKFGKSEPISIKTIQKICAHLEVNIEEIVRIHTTNKKSRGAGTFKPNQNEAIHRWYPYLEGYSGQLVKEELQKIPKDGIIFDPFAGSGTTALAAAKFGYRAVYTEINPAMRKIARAKTQIAPEVHRNASAIEELISVRCQAQNILNHQSSSQSKYSLGTFDRFFSQENLQSIGEFQHIVDNQQNENIKELASIALCSVAVPTSKMIRRGDLRFAKETELRKTSLPFWKLIIEKLDQIIEDCKYHADFESNLCTCIGHDARSFRTAQKVDAIITSPPYLNGTNYFRNTKLELRLLNLISTESELSDLYSQGITAGINNVSKKRPATKPLSSVAKLIHEITENTYDARIPKMVSGYFSDMDKAVGEMAGILKDGGKVSLDIGDSQFGGIHIPTHELLSQIMHAHKIVQTDETILRTRRSRNGSILTQRIMRFEKRK